MRSMFRLTTKTAKTHIILDPSTAPLPRCVREDVWRASHHHEPHAEVIIIIVMVTYPCKYPSHHVIQSSFFQTKGIFKFLQCGHDIAYAKYLDGVILLCESRTIMPLKAADGSKRYHPSAPTFRILHAQIFENAMQEELAERAGAQGGVIIDD